MPPDVRRGSRRCSIRPHPSMIQVVAGQTVDGVRVQLQRRRRHRRGKFWIHRASLLRRASWPCAESISPPTARRGIHACRPVSPQQTNDLGNFGSRSCAGRVAPSRPCRGGTPSRERIRVSASSGPARPSHHVLPWDHRSGRRAVGGGGGGRRGGQRRVHHAVGPSLPRVGSRRGRRWYSGRTRDGDVDGRPAQRDVHGAGRQHAERGGRPIRDRRCLGRELPRHGHGPDDGGHLRQWRSRWGFLVQQLGPRPVRAASRDRRDGRRRQRRSRHRSTPVSVIVSPFVHFAGAALLVIVRAYM